MRSAAARRRSLQHWALYLAAWLPVALVYFAIFTIWQGSSPSNAAANAVINVIPPMIMGAAIWRLSARVPWPERHSWRFVAIHLVAMACFAAIWTTCVAYELGAIGAVRQFTRGAAMIRIYVLPWQTLEGLMLYGVIAGIAYALRGASRAQALQTRAEQADRLRTQAELAALRAHINPHFLFNTLHSVMQLLRADPVRAEAALERLSELFRYVLRLDRQGVEMVSLEDEWAFASSYLWLEQMRMGERLQIDALLDDDALVCAVPPFTLQPLLENALRHGLASKAAGGTVRVRAREQDGELLIEVSDDGAGATPEQLQCATGLGLRAVRQRLDARHGGRTRTEVVGIPGQGLTVRLVLPAEPLGVAK